MSKVDFFIVGAPRCGTTSMCSYLGEHPELFIPSMKEPCLFGSDLIWLKNQPMSMADYEALFAPAGDRLRGEGTTWYVLSHVAAREIHDYNPRAKIMIHVRDPVQMLCSVHSEGIRNGYEDIVDLGQALDAEPERRAHRRVPPTCQWLNTIFYSEHGRYSEQIQRYYDAFGRDQVRVIVFDDLISDPAAVYRENLLFLGVDPDFRTEFRRINANKRLRSRRLQGWLKSPPVWLQNLEDRLPSRVVYGLKRRLTAYNERTLPRPPLEPALARRLAEHYAPEIDRLSTLLGRDLSHWCSAT